ncbi:MAG TPA: CpaF/VirB11 family protein [Erysipelothrix sp.]|nr:CpaF/VirB11 family protein [Erysipelothrix sp.]
MNKLHFSFDVIQEFIGDINITDINYNGKDIWVDHLLKGRIHYENFADYDTFYNLCVRFSNTVNLPFNQHNPLIESDFNDLRISIIHPSVSGRLSLSIRKTPSVMRMSEESIIDADYISKSGLKFLKYIVQCRCNIMISGMPGAGKTELLKFLTTYIPSHERVISIEDSYEVRYQDLHPNRDCVSLKINERFTYEDAIKASLRQRPNWILVSEIRGSEVKTLLNSIATGTHLISTIHAKDAHEIPNRMLNMIPDIDLSSLQVLSQLKEVLDIGIHIDIVVKDSGIKRYIREIVAFDGDDGMVVYHHHNKKLVRSLPDKVKERAKLFDVVFA